MKETRILLVDDEAVFTTNMSRLLGVRGYEVSVASNGEEALQRLQEEPFDVTVLDLKMPVMDGICTLKKMKALGLITEVLVLTGHGAMDTAFEAIELGAYDYVTKPCEITELVAKIEAAHARKKVKEQTA